MKYYIYLSNAKVNMLFSQIPQNIKSRIATELTINLQVISTTFKDKETEENLYSKLDIVTNYIERNFDVGTPFRPEPYIKGVLPMRWGVHLGYRAEEKSQIAFFGSITKEFIIGLGGSAKHIIGNEGTAQNIVGSATPNLVGLLREASKIEEKSIDEGKTFDEEVWAANQRGAGAALLGMTHFVRHMTGPIEQLEFFSRRLLQERNYGQMWLLCTPLYVAIAD